MDTGVEVNRFMEVRMDEKMEFSKTGATKGSYHFLSTTSGMDLTKSSRDSNLSFWKGSGSPTNCLYSSENKIV